MNTTTNTIARCAALALLPAAVLLSACRDDEVPTPKTNAATTTTTTTVTTRPATVQPVQQVAVQEQRPARSDSRGHVVSIEPIGERPSGSGAGAVIGGVLGGVLGNQVGGGDGRKAATVLGAVGGAVAGNNVERNKNSRVVGYRVSVRTEAGSTREFQRSSVNDLSVGAPVRIVDGGVQPT